MASLYTRKLLHKLRLLNIARSIKGRVVPVHNAFMPCTPHLLIAVNRSLRWSIDNDVAEGGDYLEFGIFRGFTLWYAQTLAKDMGIQKMRFFGFDSFFGLPPLKGTDQVGEFQEGAYYSPRKEVEKFLTQYEVDWCKTFLVEGWYEKTLRPETREKYALRQCSICVIDCDLYESARFALRFVEPLLRNNSIILFDDWNSFDGNPSKGEQKAFSEFLKLNPHIVAEPFIDFGLHGKGFIVNVRCL